MKRIWITALALMLLSGCGARSAAPAAPAQTPAEEEWRFALVTETESAEYADAEGKVLASVSYELPRLVLQNADGEAFTGDAPERGATAAQLDACRAFNARSDALRQTLPGADELGAEAEALRAEMEPEYRAYIGAFTEERAVTLTDAEPPLLNVTLTSYGYWGGAHGGAAVENWHFDLTRGEFVTLNDLTDDPAALRRAVAEEIIAQIDSDGALSEEMFPEYAETIRAKEDFDVIFGARSMSVGFAQYEIAPYAVGMPEFEVSYGVIARLLNERGAALLEITDEDRALGDFFEARTMWSWFDLTTMPLDPDRPAAEEGYFAVDWPGVTTMAELRALLLTRFDEGVAQELLSLGEGHYKDVDGVLCATQADRGADIAFAGAAYAVELDATGGRVIATRTLQDWNGQTEAWEVTGTDTVEFPFVRTDAGAVFTAFPDLY